MTHPRPWYERRPEGWLLVWTALTTLAFWLPTVRGAFDGPSYVWGLGSFHGRGLSADYWLPLTGSLLALACRALFWRGRARLASVALALWHLLVFAAACFWVATSPDGLRLQGDTLGMDINLAAIGPVFFGAWALVACWVVVRVFREGILTVPAWSRANSRWFVGLAALLPVQFALLRFGPPGSTADKVGVVLTLLQWMLVDRALKPRRPRRLARHRIGT